MKELIVKIPDHKIDFFMELAKELGIEAEQQPAIPDEHKRITRERIETANPDSMLTWSELKKQLSFKK